jgi:hypothetical protein
MTLTSPKSGKTDEGKSSDNVSYLYKLYNLYKFNILLLFR